MGRHLLRRGLRCLYPALAAKGLVSAYHHTRHEAHGAERQPTFYLYRKEERPYHMDYCFCAVSRIQSFEVGAYGDWSPYSDHMSLILEADIADLKR